MTSWLYALACVAIPAIWGVLMYFAFGAWERRRRRGTAGHDDGPPPVDYSI